MWVEEVLALLWKKEFEMEILVTPARLYIVELKGRNRVLTMEFYESVWEPGSGKALIFFWDQVLMPRGGDNLDGSRGF